MTPDLVARIAPLAPCYVYEQSLIRESLSKLRRAFASCRFLYSVKANPFAAVLREAALAGFGTDAASAEEVRLSLEAGIEPDDIYYSAPGKTPQDIALSIGRCRIIADSLHEIELLEHEAGSLGKIEKIGLRLNPDFGVFSEEGLPSKFGINAEDLGSVQKLLERCPHLRVSGFHMHLQSQLLDEDALSQYYFRSFSFFGRIARSLDIEPEFLNFGSGIGLAYDQLQERDLDLEKLGAAFEKHQGKFERLAHAQSFIETGRFVACRAGTYFTPVVDVKASRGKTYVIVRNGVNGFLRPAMAHLIVANNAQARDLQEPFYTNRHAFQLKAYKADGTLLTEPSKRVDVVGNLCTALDVVAADVELACVKPGDLICISNAGSYAYSLSPLAFSSHEPPKQAYLLEDGELKC